ncbi:MAG: hypothetical protein LBP75_04755 [Planctomycetota bacterium]|jgi:hypothetical protein|nr:hypothetical protein [Planctomycetota bacterium]
MFDVMATPAPPRAKIKTAALCAVGIGLSFGLLFFPAVRGGLGGLGIVIGALILLYAVGKLLVTFPAVMAPRGFARLALAVVALGVAGLALGVYLSPEWRDFLTAHFKSALEPKLAMDVWLARLSKWAFAGFVIAAAISVLSLSKPGTALLRGLAIIGDFSIKIEPVNDEPSAATA